MRKLMKMLAVLVVLALVAAGLYGWARSSGKDEKGLKRVTIERGDITEKAIAVGQIQPRLEFEVKSKIPGIVSRALVDVGDTVKAGDPLFEIRPDPTPLEISDVDRRVESARASFNRAKTEYDRARELSEAGVMPKAELEARAEGFELARIALLKAEQDRELTRRGRLAGGGTESTIRSPAAGVLLTRNVDPGDPVVPLTSFQPGTELATIADMSDLIFRGTVDEIDVGKLSAGMPARIKIGALPTDVVTGIVSRIAPQAKKSEGATLFDVEIELDPNQEIQLRAGYSANADVIIREKTDVVVVPERLVIWENGGQKAFVELAADTPEGAPRRVEIKTGISDGMHVEVVEGLDAGAVIVERPPKEIS